MQSYGVRRRFGRPKELRKAPSPLYVAGLKARNEGVSAFRSLVQAWLSLDEVESFKSSEGEGPRIRPSPPGDRNGSSRRRARPG